MHFMKKKPIDIIESKVKIKITSSSSIINFMQNSYGGFKAKISLEDQNIEEIRNQLNEFFGGTAPSKAAINGLPNFQNTCPWWDLDEKNIEITYIRFVDERKFFTRMSHKVWVFVSKDHNGQRYLYIAY